jgi:hypothetical protein
LIHQNEIHDGLTISNLTFRLNVKML